MEQRIKAADFPFFPRVFLVGAPRCGTTSISKSLARHPQICFSRPKELNYFTHAQLDSPAKLQQEYLDRYFAHCDPQTHCLLGEGSVTYLYDPDAIRRILSVQPEARFVVAVRNPIDMLRSYHFRLLFLLEEDEANFERAWKLQEARLRGEHIPKRCSDPRRLRYRDVASLGSLVERLIDLAGRDRCHVVVNEDLKASPLETYRELLRFAGVDDGMATLSAAGLTRFPHRLKSRSYRWRWLQTLLYKPPAAVFKAVDRGEINRGVRPFRLKQLHKRLLGLNLVQREPPPFSPELRAMLHEAFADDIRKLERTLGRSFAHWC